MPRHETTIQGKLEAWLAHQKEAGRLPHNTNQLAKVVGTSQSTAREWVANGRRPSEHFLQEIADAMNATLAWLISERTSWPPPEPPVPTPSLLAELVVLPRAESVDLFELLQHEKGRRRLMSRLRPFVEGLRVSSLSSAMPNGMSVAEMQGAGAYLPWPTDSLVPQMWERDRVSVGLLEALASELRARMQSIEGDLSGDVKETPETKIAARELELAIQYRGADVRQAQRYARDAFTRHVLGPANTLMKTIDEALALIREHHDDTPPRKAQRIGVAEAMRQAAREVEISLSGGLLEGFERKWASDLYMQRDGGGGLQVGAALQMAGMLAETLGSESEIIRPFPEELVPSAIRARRVITLRHDGALCRIEPFAIGESEDGEVLLYAYQLLGPPHRNLASPPNKKHPMNEGWVTLEMKRVEGVWEEDAKFSPSRSEWQEAKSELERIVVHV